MPKVTSWADQTVIVAHVPMVRWGIKRSEYKDWESIEEHQWFVHRESKHVSDENNECECLHIPRWWWDMNKKQRAEYRRHLYS
jgi:hypothetical protein